MKAIRVHELGGAEKLSLDEIEKPTPKADEVLVKVAAAGINYADTMMRSGNYLTKPDLPMMLGYEAAGTIEELGAEVSNLKVGQRVLATTSSGGYAEFATAKAAATMPIPDELGFGESTALLVQGLTALGLLNETQSGRFDLDSRGGGRRWNSACSTGETQRFEGSRHGFERAETAKGRQPWRRFRH